MSTQIALVILGNPVSGAGLQTLATLGRFPSEEFEKMDSTPLIKEEVNYGIRHANNYITYTVKNTTVRASDASRAGRLFISIAIPRLLILKDNESPYTLLKEIYNKFIDDYMTASTEGPLVYNKNIEVNKFDFELIMQKYDVADRKGLYVTMPDTGGVGIVCAPTEDKLTELFRDSQYPEFKNFSHIEIGRTCQPNVQIDIPRKKEYHVYLNRTPQHVTLIEDEDCFDSSKYLIDDNYNTYKDTHVYFTLGDLMASSDGSLFGGRVKLIGNQINCTVESKPKEFEFTAEISSQSGEKLEGEDREKVLKLLEKKTIRVLYGGEDITKAFVTGERFLVFGSAIKNQLFLTPDNTEDFEFGVNKDTYNKKLLLSVKTKRKKQDFPLQKSSVPAKKLPASINVDGLKIIIYNNKAGDYDAILYVGNDDKKRYQLRQPLFFVPQNGLYVATMFVDRFWANGDTYLRLERYKKGTKKCSVEQQLFFKNDQVTVDVSQLSFSPLRTKNRWKKMVVLLAGLALLFFIIGSIVGAVVVNQLKDEEKKEEPTELYENLVDDEKNTSETTVQTEDMDTQVQVPDQETTQKEIEDSPEFQPKPVVEKSESPSVPDYTAQIVEAANNRDWNKVDGLLKKALKAKQITNAQSNAIAHYYYNNPKYTDVEKRKIEKALGNEGGKQFTSIEDLVYFYNNVILKRLQ